MKINKKSKIATITATALLTIAFIPFASEYINTNIAPALPSFEVSAWNPEQGRTPGFFDSNSIPLEPDTGDNNQGGNNQKDNDQKDNDQKDNDQKDNKPSGEPETQSTPSPEPQEETKPAPSPEPSYTYYERHERNDKDTEPKTSAYESVMKAIRENNKDKEPVEVKEENVPLATPEKEETVKEKEEPVEIPEENVPLAAPEKEPVEIVPDQVPKSVPKKKPALPRTGQSEAAGILGLSLVVAAAYIKKKTNK